MTAINSTYRQAEEHKEREEPQGTMWGSMPQTKQAHLEANQLNN